MAWNDDVDKAIVELASLETDAQLKVVLDNYGRFCASMARIAAVAAEDAPSLLAPEDPDVASLRSRLAKERFLAEGYRACTDFPYYERGFGVYAGPGAARSDLDQFCAGYQSPIREQLENLLVETGFLRIIGPGDCIDVEGIEAIMQLNTLVVEGEEAVGNSGGEFGARYAFFAGDLEEGFVLERRTGSVHRFRQDDDHRPGRDWQREPLVQVGQSIHAWLGTVVRDYGRSYTNDQESKPRILL